MKELLTRWQDHFRGRLHDPASWSTQREHLVNLTYVPTGAGFTGTSQLEKFASLFPASEHFLAPGQIQRFNNDYRVISSSINETARSVTEEVVISSLHNRRIDYFLPGIEPTNLTFTISLAIVGRFAEEDHLLQDVRIYWDQASILRQLGIFHLAFHNLIKSIGKETSFDNELDKVPIADGQRVAQRLLHPTINNCNMLSPLELIKLGGMSSNENKQVTKLAPIGGLDNIQELSQQLPTLSSPKREHQAKALPAFTSSVFSNKEEAPQHIKKCDTIPAALKSHLKLGDGSDERPVPRQSSQDYSMHKPPSIFGEQHDIPTQQLYLAGAERMRNTSKIFQEEHGVANQLGGLSFNPSLPLTDRSRFESKVFADSPTRTPNVKSLPQLQSQICFGDVDESRGGDAVSLIPPKPIIQSNNHSSPFARDNDKEEREERPLQYNRNPQLSSHFVGGGVYACSPMKVESTTILAEGVDARGNRSTLKLTDNPKEDAAASAPLINPRAASHNQSSLTLGDNPSPTPVTVGTRVLQPPGGRSTIFLSGN